MNITDIKLGETYQYYFDKAGTLMHRPVQVVQITGNKITVKESNGTKMTVSASDLDNRQIEAF